MMKFLVQYKTALLALAVVVVGYTLYVSYFSNGGDDAVLVAIEATSAEGVENQDLIRLLNEVKSITLDGALFSDPVFISLTDFTQTLSPEPSGRPNPFAPLSGVSATTEIP